MKKIIYIIAFISVVILGILGCEKEQNFYEVGKQQTFLQYPSNDTIIVLKVDSSLNLQQFSWTCKRPYVAYELIFDDKTKSVTLDVGATNKIYKTHNELDNILAGMGIKLGETKTVYWTLNSKDNEASWCEDSSKITFTRFNLPPYQFSLNSPASGASFELDKADPFRLFPFSFESNAEDVNYQIQIDTTESMKNALIIYEGTELFYEPTHYEMDSLAGLLGVESGISEKVYWRVKAIGDQINSTTQLSPSQSFNIKRFDKSEPIILTSFPNETEKLNLNYEQKNEIVNSISWSVSALGNFAIRYSLNEDMSDSEIKELGPEKSYDFTNASLDSLMNDLGVSYLSRTIYYQIESIDNINITPSDMKQITLTGMLKPLIDIRGNEENNYPVTRITLSNGEERVWMARNLNANVYSDGTPLVEDRKSYTESVFSYFLDIAGGYYTWPTVVRSSDGSSVSEPVQGICPDGWHVATKDECQELIDYVGGQNNSNSLRDGNFWSTGNGTNTTGLSVVQNGYFWHSGMGDVMTEAGGQGTIWTSTTDGNNNAINWYFYWNNYMALESNPRLLFEDGGGTASRMSAVRCVRNY